MKYINISKLPQRVPYDRYGKGFNDCLDQVLDAVEEKDLVELRYGRWKGAGMGDYLCSECWEVYSGGDKFTYCPNCGAKMDE